MDALSGGRARRALSVRAAQRAALQGMLGCCDAGGVGWKVLVYDDAARDVVAPLLRVADLRAAGVTLHLRAGAARQPVRDVPAVYLVGADEEGVRVVVEDVAKGLYESAWVHFLGRVPRRLLEALGEGVARGGGGVRRVFDMYADFVALEDDLFSLRVPRAFVDLHRRGARDSEVQGALERVVDRLMCVLVTLRAVPVVRAQRGGPAEMVAGLLEVRLREALLPGAALFEGAGVGEGSFVAAAARPLLVLLDRNVDLSVMLHHTWTYQALAHDALGLSLNRVSVPVRDPVSGVDRVRVFDMDKGDAFWEGNAGLPFPMVAEAVEGAIQEYKEEVAGISESANAMGEGGVPVQHLAAGGLQGGDGVPAPDLAAAVQSLPELSKKKARIDLHTNIATALLESIKSRGLDGYYKTEEELLSRPQAFDVERIVALIGDPKGTVADKLRLFLIYYLCVDAVPQAQLARCTSALESAGCGDMRAYAYLKSIKAFTSSMASIGSFGAPGDDAASGINSSYAAVLGTLSQVANNVGNLILSADNALPVSRIVSTLMEGKGDAEVLDGYVTIDVKAGRGGGYAPAARKPFQEAIVCVVGPGNYIEYQNCKDHICSTVTKDGGKTRMAPNGKTVIYGCTELSSGAEFLEQLAELGGQLASTGSTASLNGSTSAPGV